MRGAMKSVVLVGVWLASSVAVDVNSGVQAAKDVNSGVASPVEAQHLRQESEQQKEWGLLGSWGLWGRGCGLGLLGCGWGLGGWGLGGCI